MSSATGIPENIDSLMSEGGEQEPLLGRVGDASQQHGKPIYENLILGTGVIVQAGIWILVAVVWSGVFSFPLITFSAHPLLNSAGLLLLTQGILILQPTHTAEQKKLGTYIHAAVIDLGLALLIAGLVVIEISKASHPGSHLKSVHAILGLITYILLFLQAAVGVTQYFVPQLYGGVANAKSIYKYHRLSGYVVLTVALATVAAATQTDFNISSLHIPLWAVLVAEVLTVAGLYARIKKQKLGL